MKMASKIQSVMVNRFNGIKITVPAKLLGGLALGAILMTAVALPSGNVHASPLVDISNLGGGITDFEEPYTGDVNVDSDLGGGITDFEEALTSKVNVISDLGGGITDFEEPYTGKVNIASDLGGGITDFEEPYIGKISLLPTQAYRNEQANIFRVVEL